MQYQTVPLRSRKSLFKGIKIYVIPEIFFKNGRYKTPTAIRKSGKLVPKKIKRQNQEATSKFKDLLFYANVKKAKQFLSVLLPVKDLDEHDTIWFFVQAGSYRNGELNDDIPGQLLFHGKKFSDFLLLEGKIIISKDRSKMKELWKPVYKDWFKKGANKTGVTLVKLEPTEGYYWNAKQNMVAALPKKSDAKTTKSPGDTVERKTRNG